MCNGIQGLKIAPRRKGANTLVLGGSLAFVDFSLKENGKGKGGAGWKHIDESNGSCLTKSGFSHHGPVFLNAG